ncbi:unnamed protein product [Ceutorhynchus assimilis]|uniref:CUB domain-containing protein n=1 Tax=Ceutorhynchus assimilis TaxID=467358 RepID=A0A9N9MMD6_9CUCU|nr:unnamed protein product [Ceutorhynchus assimilis]
MIFFGVFFIFLTSSVKSENCGKIFTQNQFILTSENYPQPYPNNKVCFYLLKGNNNCTKEFRIEFLDFDLPKTVGCVKNRLEIGSQDALCGAKNGSKVYPSERGLLKLKFVSDGQEVEEKGRGFRLFVTRIDNDFCTVETTRSDNNNEFPVNKINTTYLPPASNPCCLNNIFSSKTFLLISPNFPYSNNQAKNCTFIIRKFSSSVCRLRIKILFFNLGPVSGKTCPYGYLEIDRKLICGCNADLQLTTNFYEENKFFKFYSEGFGLEGANGFALEVVQDECQKRYEPEDGIEKLTKNKFRFYNDQNNRIQFPIIDQLKLIEEKNYYSTNENKHIYFFAPEDENNSDETLWTREEEKEKTINNIDISSNINNILTNKNRQCFNWNNNQLANLQKRFGQSLTQMCKFVQDSRNDNCIILRNLSGNFQSPGFPATYPANMNVCFRFALSPGYCAIKMYFEEFDIERSYDCLKDYLSVDQYRYCGKYLRNRQVTINSYKSLIFMSDANYCGKGFSALYQQVRCQTPDNDSNNSIRPSINCNPAGGKSADGDNSIPTSMIPPVACEKVFADKYFIIRNEFVGSNLCFYDVRRHNKNICKLRLDFDQFNIPCHLASIRINGRLYCGQKSGQSVIIPMRDNVSIVYKNNGQYLNPDPDALFIRGMQIDTDCDVIPEAARIVSPEIYYPTQTEVSLYRSVNN